MFRISARQILAIALLSALFAVGTIAVMNRFTDRIQPSSAAFTEAAPAGITDPGHGHGRTKQHRDLPHTFAGRRQRSFHFIRSRLLRFC